MDCIPLISYKARAECFIDVARFLATVPLESLTVYRPDPRVGDVIVEFSSALTLAQLGEYLRRIPDGHVMAETVAHFLDYTGERRVGER